MSCFLIDEVNNFTQISFNFAVLTYLSGINPSSFTITRYARNPLITKYSKTFENKGSYSVCLSFSFKSIYRAVFTK